MVFLVSERARMIRRNSEDITNINVVGSLGQERIRRKVRLI
jgi:hypothetical protein